MPSESDKQMHGPLEAYARKRRDDAGAPLELHPATRRMLQAEVARAYPRPERAGESWLARLNRLWPRLAFASAVAAALGVVVWISIPPQKKGVPADTTVALGVPLSEPARSRLEREPLAEERRAASRPVERGSVVVPGKAGDESRIHLAKGGEWKDGSGTQGPPAQTVSADALGRQSSPEVMLNAPAAAPTKPASLADAARDGLTVRQELTQAAAPSSSPAAPALVPPPAPAAPSVATKAGGLKGGAASVTGLAPSAPAPTGGVPALQMAKAPQDRVDSLATFGTGTSLAEHDLKVRTAQTSGLAGGQMKLGLAATTAGDKAEGAVAGRLMKAAEAPSTGVTPALQSRGGASPADVAAGHWFALNFASEGPSGAESDGSRRAFYGVATPEKAGPPSAAAAPVLANFRLEQTGNQVRLVDMDGSVYAGVLGEDTVESEKAGADRERFKELVAPRQREAAERTRALADTQQWEWAPVAQATNYVSFSASGSNRTLGQPVFVRGRLLSANEADAVLAPNVAQFTPGQQAGAPATLPTQTAPTRRSQPEPAAARAQMGAYFQAPEDQNPSNVQFRIEGLKQIGTNPAVPFRANSQVP